MNSAAELTALREAFARAMAESDDDRRHWLMGCLIDYAPRQVNAVRQRWREIKNETKEERK